MFTSKFSILALATIAYFADDLVSQVSASEASESLETSSPTATSDAGPKATPKATRRKAGASGKRIGDATEGMPQVRRIEGKEQCRVIATDSKGKVLTIGKGKECSTAVLNSTRDKAKAILAHQRRRLAKGKVSDMIAAKIAATTGVAFKLQWLTGRGWMDDNAASE